MHDNLKVFSMKQEAIERNPKKGLREVLRTWARLEIICSL